MKYDDEGPLSTHIELDRSILIIKKDHVPGHPNQIGLDMRFKCNKDFIKKYGWGKIKPTI